MNKNQNTYSLFVGIERWYLGWMLDFEDMDWAVRMADKTADRQSYESEHLAIYHQ